jgi:hypothetical protein
VRKLLQNHRFSWCCLQWNKWTGRDSETWLNECKFLCIFNSIWNQDTAPVIQACYFHYYIFTGDWDEPKYSFLFEPANIQDSNPRNFIRRDRIKSII